MAIRALDLKNPGIIIATFSVSIELARGQHLLHAYKDSPKHCMNSIMGLL